MSRAEMMKLLSGASPEDRKFLEEYLGELCRKETAPLQDVPAANDAFYHLPEPACDDLQPLSNDKIDRLIYGCD